MAKKRCKRLLSIDSLIKTTSSETSGFHVSYNDSDRFGERESVFYHLFPFRTGSLTIRQSTGKKSVKDYGSRRFKLVQLTFALTEPRPGTPAWSAKPKANGLIEFVE